MFLLGSAFLVYPAVFEIVHMLRFGEGAPENERSGTKSAIGVIATIVAMHLKFSFGSILSEIAVTGVALFLVEIFQSMYQRRPAKAARTHPFRAAGEGLQLE